MRLTLWFLAQEIFDLKLEGKPPPPKPAEKEKLGGGSFGNFEFGYGSSYGEVNARDNRKT